MYNLNCIKKILFSLLLVIIASASYSQVVVPEGILFQAVARDANNNAASNRNVYVQIAIKRSTTNGTTDYAESFKVVLGTTQHAITFSSHSATFTAGTMLTINGWNGTSATTAITKNGQLATTSSAYVDYRGAQQNVILGGLNQYGQILYGLQGTTGQASQLIINNAATNGGTASVLTAAQLNQFNFINGVTLAQYAGVYKASSTTEIVPSATSR